MFEKILLSTIILIEFLHLQETYFNKKRTTLRLCVLCCLRYSIGVKTSAPLLQIGQMKSGGSVSLSST